MSDARKTAKCSFPGIPHISGKIPIYKGQIQSTHRALGTYINKQNILRRDSKFTILKIRIKEAKSATMNIFGKEIFSFQIIL